VGVVAPRPDNWAGGHGATASKRLGALAGPCFFLRVSPGPPGQPHGNAAICTCRPGGLKFHWRYPNGMIRDGHQV
jgi:hypothetical protein